MRIAFALCLLPFAFCLRAESAQDNAGASAGATLRFSPSVRASAMGDAFTATAQGVSASHYNPAGLGWSRDHEVSLMYQDMALDIGQGAIGYSSPLGTRSAWAVLGQYVDFGSTARTVVNGAGTAGVSSGSFAGHDIAVGLSYGSRLSSWGYGATGRIYSSDIDNVTATAFAADLGLKWEEDDSPWAFGVTIRNLGTNVKYDHVAEHLPITFRAGAAWQALGKRDSSRFGLLLTADIQKIMEENWSGHAGAEFTFADMFALRAGYNGSVEIDNGFTVGAGFRKSGLELDYAFVPFGIVGNSHRVGIQYKF